MCGAGADLPYSVSLRPLRAALFWRKCNQPTVPMSRVGMGAGAGAAARFGAGPSWTPCGRGQGGLHHATVGVVARAPQDAEDRHTALQRSFAWLESALKEKEAALRSAESQLAAAKVGKGALAGVCSLP